MSETKQITKHTTQVFPSNYTWQIENFLNVPDSLYVSEKFDIPGTNFYSIAHVRNNRARQYLEMKLVLGYHGKRIEESEYKASFYEIKVNVPKYGDVWVVPLKPLSPVVWEIKDVCPSADVLKYVDQAGILELKISVSINSTRLLKDVAIRPVDSFSALSENLKNALQEDEDLKDFTFKIEGKDIAVHKAILAARSPVFRKMFTTNMKEAKNNGTDDIKDVKFDTFQEMIFFIYSGQVTDNFSNLAMELFEAAHKYQIETLMKLCEQKIHENLTEENATAVLQLAHLFDCSETLKQEALELHKRKRHKEIDSLSFADNKIKLEESENEESFLQNFNTN